MSRAADDVRTGEGGPLWLSDDDVAAAVGLPAAMAALTAVLLSAHRGGSQALPKSMASWQPASSAHTLGAHDAGSDLVAFKNWVNTPRGASALLTLFAAGDGALLGVFEAGTLGSLRTAGLAGIATDRLSALDADELALLGTGRQALHQVAVVAAVRPLRRVRVWSPSAESRTRFARRITDATGIVAEPAPTVERATRGAPIVTTITRATEPFVHSADIDPGAHVNAVGAILPHAAELAPGVLERARLTVVDDLENARRSSRELSNRFGDDWHEVATLGALLSGELPSHSRTDLAAPHDITVYKGVGSGIADLAIAALAHRIRTARTDTRFRPEDHTRTRTE